MSVYQQSNSEPQSQETSKELENPYTSKSCSYNGEDTSLLVAGKEENPTDSHPSCSSSAAGGSRDSVGMEPSFNNQGDNAYTPNTRMIRLRGFKEPDFNAESSSTYLHNVTTDHLQTKHSDVKSCHGESSQNTPTQNKADSFSKDTEDHLQTKYSEVKSCHGESSKNTPIQNNADSVSKVTEDHLQTKYSEVKSCHGENSQNTPQPFLATQLPGNLPLVVVLRSIARYGKISNQSGDLQVWDPEFKIPDDIHEILLRRYYHTPEIGIRIIRHSGGALECHQSPNFSLRPSFSWMTI